MPSKQNPSYAPVLSIQQASIFCSVRTEVFAADVIGFLLMYSCSAYTLSVVAFIA